MNNPSLENGAQILNDMGVDKKFIHDIYGKYGSYASKIGLNPNSLKGMVDKLGNSINTNSPKNISTPTRNIKSGFDSSKYPKI